MTKPIPKVYLSRSQALLLQRVIKTFARVHTEHLGEARRENKRQLREDVKRDPLLLNVLDLHLREARELKAKHDVVQAWALSDEPKASLFAYMRTHIAETNPNAVLKDSWIFDEARWAEHVLEASLEDGKQEAPGPPALMLAVQKEVQRILEELKVVRRPRKRRDNG